MDKIQFITDLKAGQEVASLFLLSSASQGQAKNGPFWKLALRDATGSLEAKIWSPQSQAYPELRAGDMCEVYGRVSIYRERLEIAVDRLRVLSDGEKASIDLADFMPASERSAAEMLEDLRSLCAKTFTHAPWKKFITALLRDEEFTGKLLPAPAAKGMHHVYAGGLLEHTLSVATLCMLLADHYPDLDRQTLLAGAVCHDLGKVWELTQGLNFDYTSEGRLLGHMQLALDYLEPRLRKAGLEPELAVHFKHLILSHHGQHEFGSPRLPSTAEAFILHYADNIDAKMNQIRTALSGVEDGQSGWSAYTPGLDRFLFQSLKSPEKLRTGRQTKKNDDEDDGGQLSLLG